MCTSSQMCMNRCMSGTSMLKGECMSGNISWNICLLSPMTTVSIPFLRPRSIVLNLSQEKLQLISNYKNCLCSSPKWSSTTSRHYRSSPPEQPKSYEWAFTVLSLSPPSNDHIRWTRSGSGILSNILRAAMEARCF